MKFGNKFTLGGLLILGSSFFFCVLCQAADPLTAIDILLEPDDAMVTKANADNTRLRENYPEGFALDATHVPHISVLQCYVRTKDLDKVSAAVKRVVDAQKPVGMELKTMGFFYVPWQGQELAGITVAPMPQLLKYQEAILAAVAPLTVKGGTAAAFVPSEDGSPASEAIVNYVSTFVSQHTGEHYSPHVTIGLAKEDFLKEMTAASYTPFTFKIKNVGVYHLGDFGTARKKIWAPAAYPLTVIRVVDGDTLQLSNGEKVGLIGIDAPESSNNFKLWRDAERTDQDTKEILEMGKEAAEFTRKLVEGKQVRFEYDVQRKDKYGRTLAYVYFQIPAMNLVPPDYAVETKECPEGYIKGEQTCLWKVSVNATLIKAGYAQVMTVPPNVKYQELFLGLEEEATEQKRGLWRDKVEADQKKMGYNFGIEDATGLGNVRASNAKVGADYKVSENSTVGVEASRKINDAQDAAAWGKSTEDGNAAQAKYKLSF